MSHPAGALNSLDSIFGDGASGSASYSSGQTFADSAYTDLTITTNSSGMVVSGIRIFVKGTMTVGTQNVTLTAKGDVGGQGTVGNSGGTGGSPGASASAKTVCVGVQGEGGSLLNGAVCDSGATAGCQISNLFGGRGGRGGNGGYGLWGENYEDAGVAGANAVIKRPFIPLHPDILFDRLMSSTTWYAGQGGGGGGAGGGCAYVVSGAPNGAGGGAGGTGGSMVVLFVKKLVLNTTLTLNAAGGNSGRGAPGTYIAEDGNGGSGSGGAGGGGCVILVVGERSGAGSLIVNVSGGDGYYGYAGGGIGGAGYPGLGGSRGSLWYLNLAAGISTYYAASDTVQTDITGEAGVYTL